MGREFDVNATNKEQVELGNVWYSNYVYNEAAHASI